MTHARAVSCLLALVCLGSCAVGVEDEAPAASVAAEALGEPQDGFPSWEERVVHVWVNRARADPATELAGCTECAEKACYSAAPPMVWSHALGRAARFHSDMLSKWRGGLTHNSPCALPADVSDRYTPGTCDGDPTCGCEGGAALCATGPACQTASCPTCTPFSTRVQRFGGFPRAENIASSGSPLAAMNAWLTERYDVATCGYGIDSMGRPNGHRFNILAPDRTSIGVGAAGSLYTQDFGSDATPNGIVAGVHYPETGPDVELRASWFHTGAPTVARVNVGGACQTMTIERGTATNGTYLATATIGAGCTRYAFEFEGPSGAVTFPTTGSYGIGCPEDWSSARPPTCGCTPVCAGRACGDDGCGGSCGSCGPSDACRAADGQCVPTGVDAGPATDGGTPPGDGGVVVPTTDGGTTAPDAGATEDVVTGSCSCTVGQRSEPSGGVVAALAMLGLALARRSRRRALGISVAASLTIAACGGDPMVRSDDGGSNQPDAHVPTDAPAPMLVDAANDTGVPPIDTGVPPIDTGVPPIDAGPFDAGPPGSGCEWETLIDQRGVVHTVTEADPGHTVRFLPPGKGFFCARVSVTMQTQDNLAEIDAANDGCPIFTHIAGLEGTTSTGRNLGGAFFRLLKLDCTPRRPGAIELNVWGEPEGRSALKTANPWIAGRAYRVVLEVVPFVTSISMFDPTTGAQLGPTVSEEISGTTVDMTRDAQVVLSLPRIFDGAYWPYFGSVYSDLLVEAAVAD